MVRHICITAFQTEIKHKRGAGKPLARQAAIRPPAPQPIRYEIGHGLGKIGVDNDGISAELARRRAHPHGPPTRKNQLLNGLVQSDIGA